MSTNQSDFVNSIISSLGYLSKRDIIENLFIRSLLESYERIDKKIGVENEIRDRFIRDLYQTKSELSSFLQIKWIDLIWENWVFTNDYKLARTDIAFKMTGLHFILECKRLNSPDKAYVGEGLERFIQLKYAEGDEYAGMIGFIVSGNREKISVGIKSRIENLEHTISTKDTLSGLGFNSRHIRTDKTPIEIYHLFFDFKLANSGD